MTQSTQSKLNEQDNKYERDFYKKVFLSVLAFAVLALASAFAVQFIIAEPKPAVSANLDAQTLGNFFIFVFATSVAFAGALVVIKIASNQEKLAKTQLDLAKNQERLAEAQLGIASRSTPEYESALIAAFAVKNGIQSIQQQISLLFGLYFYYHKAEVNDEDKDRYLLSLELNAKEFIESITTNLQEPWLLHLVEYEETASKDNGNANIIYLLSNKMCLELKKLSYIITAEEFTDKEKRLSVIHENLNNIRLRSLAFFANLQKVRHKHQSLIIEGKIQPSNSNEPSIAAAIHNQLMKNNLELNLTNI